MAPDRTKKPLAAVLAKPAALFQDFHVLHRARITGAHMVTYQESRSYRAAELLEKCSDQPTHWMRRSPRLQQVT